MTWIFLLIVVFILAAFLLSNRKEKRPNNDASISNVEKEALDQDYLSHGGHDNDDRKNL